MNSRDPHQAVFTTPPAAVPAGNVDVSGNGRWRIWQDAGTKIDAPILGNGDLLAAFSCTPGYPQFWITTNDFWQMESAANWEFFHDNGTAKHDPPVSLGSPRPVGRFVFDIPALRQAECIVEQDFDSAVTQAVYTLPEGGTFTLNSYVAATENLLVLTFSADRDIAVTPEFRFPDEPGKGCSVGVDFEGSGEGEELLNGTFKGLIGGKPVQIKKCRDGVISGYREFSDRVDVSTKAGFAGTFLDNEQRNRMEQPHDYDLPTQVLKAGTVSTYIIPVRSQRKVSRPYEYAISRARWITEQELKDIYERHLSWWHGFWSESDISLDDEQIEQRYRLSQYMMASLSRDPDYPPNILGISTFDRMAWNGNYKINYNHQSPYLGLLVSGHFAQSDPHDAPYLALSDLPKEMSLRLLGHEGCLYPLGLGPLGMVSEALLLHMKSPAVHGALNMLMRYALTLDTDYGRKVYPFLLSVADFWEKDLVQRDGYYHVVGDGMHERVTQDVLENGLPEDPVNTLGYLHTFFPMMVNLSKDLGLNADRRAGWQDIAAHLAPYPQGTIRQINDNPTLWAENETKLCDVVPEEMMDLPVYYDEGKGGKWSYHFPGNIMHIYPGNAIGLGSDDTELETARNTIAMHSLIEHRLAGDDFRARDGAWNATNLSCLFFPATVRVGYDPEQIWQELKDRISQVGLPNGFIDGNPHGIENLSTIPNTIQEMMLQSQEGIIRLFPVWPRQSHPDASFRDFWAYGAFRVSAELRQGMVQSVRIRSLKGSPLRVQNPWGCAAVQIDSVQRNRTTIHEGAVLETETFAGEELLIRSGL